MSGKAPAPELDGAILLRCRAQDPMAFQAFVARYERMVFALLAQMLGPGAHVEDLAQDTFLRAYEAFPRFDVAAGKASTWLLTIAMRLAINEHKRRRPKPAYEIDVAEQMLNNAALVDRLGMQTCLQAVMESMPLAETSESIRRVGEIRAGLRRMPGENEALNPVERMLLGFTGETRAFESDLARSFGPDEAHRITFHDDKCMLTMAF